MKGDEPSDVYSIPSATGAPKGAQAPSNIATVEDSNPVIREFVQTAK
jgi:hypothetical protein